METDLIMKNANKILDFYSTYDLYIAGKIKNRNAFELIKEIEQKFPVDSIKLSDGTKIWNLLRVFFYSNFQKESETLESGINRKFLKKLFSILKESFRPLKLPERRITFYGFSGTENRRLRDGFFYDIYMDPLYDVLGDNFCVFEWPTAEGYRRKYDEKVYSKNYVPVHIPTKTLWQLTFHKLLGKTDFSIENENILVDVIKFFAKGASVEYSKLKKDAYDFIAVFFYVKKFLSKLLRARHPKAVLMRCGYGRFHMALSQACRESEIPSIELQHGLITKYHIGYVKKEKSKNKDCVPEYLLAYGKAFSEIVKDGNLFDEKKVIDSGFPYLEEVISSSAILEDTIKKFLTSFDRFILITSQWILAKEIKDFVAELAKEIKEKMPNVGLIFKPHPNDRNNYFDINFKNVFVVNKYGDTYAILKAIDVHSTVYSTTGIETLAFGKPNIFMDIKGIHKNLENDELYIVSTPPQFIETLEYIISNYESVSRAALKTSEAFFKHNAKKNFENFLNSIGIHI